MSSNGSAPGAGPRRANEQTPLLKDQANDTDTSPQPNGAADEEEAGSSEGAADEPEWSTSHLLLTLGAAYFGVFLAAMDSTIVATISAPISSSFNSFTLLSWLASAYLIANAGFQPISGKLSDIYGRRPCLVLATLIFAAGNLICGLAKDEWVIILGRVVSGIGGGCMNTISTFAASDVIPLRRRGLWQGFGNICFGVGSGIGGVFGGWMNDAFNWRWAFLIQVPLTLICTLIIFFTMKIPVKESDKSKIKRVDFLGAFTLVAALVLLLLGLNSGGNAVPWNHPLVYISLPFAGILLGAFVYIEHRVAKEPIIPVRLLLYRTVASGCFVNWTITMAYFAYIYYVPVYFQVRGLSATASGVRLIPNAVGLAVGSFGSGYIMKLTGRYWWLNFGVEWLFVLSTALMAGLFKLTIPEWAPFIILFLGGLGYGSMLTITLLALISAVPHEYQAVITSASYAARSTGSAIGIAIASAVFQNLLTKRLWEKFGDRKNAAHIVRMLRDNIDKLKELSKSDKALALAAYIGALNGVWFTMLGLGILGALASLLMRENKLYSNLARK